MNSPYLADFIDQRPLGKQQYLILILCGLLMVLDGFDVQSVSYAAPAILADWGIAKTELGAVFGSGLLGLLIGSLVLSYFSDRLGRKPILLFSTLFFSVCLLATAWVQDIQQLVILRFVTGLGLGAIMPNTMALCGEVVPKKQRVSVMMLISCGFTVGAMLGGFLAAWLIPQWGWRSVFVVGGVLPLILMVLIIKNIPESLQYLAVRNIHDPKITQTLHQFYPDEVIPNSFQPLEVKKSMPVRALFEKNRYQFTLTIWLISLMNMIALYFLSSWMPTLAKLTGLSIEKSILLGATLQLGGTLGTIVMGLWIDKKGFFKVLTPIYVVAAIFIATLGLTVSSLPFFFLFVFVIGFTVIGGQPAINAMSADYYPTEYRTTGVGWSLGIGRIGSVIGPVLGGWVVQSGAFSPQQLFYFVAIPSLVIIVTLLVQQTMGLLKRT